MFAVQVRKASGALLKFLRERDEGKETRQLLADDEEEKVYLQLVFQRIPRDVQHKPIRLCVQIWPERTVVYAVQPVVWSLAHFAGQFLTHCKIRRKESNCVSSSKCVSTLSLPSLLPILCKRRRSCLAGPALGN